MDESERYGDSLRSLSWRLVRGRDLLRALSSKEKTLRVLYKLGKLDFVQLRVAQHKISASQKA